MVGGGDAGVGTVIGGVGTVTHPPRGCASGFMSNRFRREGPAKCFEDVGIPVSFDDHFRVEAIRKFPIGF